MAKNKITLKRVNKRERHKKVEEENDVRGLFKTIIIVLVSFLVCYLLFLLMGKAGMFEKGYEAPEKGSNTFTYNTAIIGTVFNRPESEYYVAFDEEDGDKYFETILGMYNGSLQIYKVNMSLGINSKYSGVEGNSKAQRSSDLVISGPTLIKIKDGRNIKYLDNLDLIKEELNN